MNRIVVLVAALLLGGGSASFAQQDPDDPGMQDSLIVVCNPNHVDSTGSLQTVLVEIYASTDDTIMYYNFPMRWLAPIGGITYAAGTVFYYPISAWDGHGEMLNPDENYLWQLGTANIFVYSHNPPLFTGGQRIHVWTLHFTVAPHTPSQMVVFDTCFHPVVGGVAFSDVLGDMEITPGFQPGFLTIGVVGTEGDGSLPGAPSLSRNYPNPFNASTTIEYALQSATDVELTIYDILGRNVITLADGLLGAGTHRIVWDGKDYAGRAMPSALYFYAIRAGEFVAIKKMTMIK